MVKELPKLSTAEESYGQLYVKTMIKFLLGMSPSNSSLISQIWDAMVAMLLVSTST